MTEFAAPAAPVLLVLLSWTLLRREAETVERLAADLTEYHLTEAGDNRRVVHSTMSRFGEQFFFELINESNHCGSNLGYLVSSFTGAEQTDGLWGCRDRREDTEATH